MLDKLETVVHRFEEVSNLISDPTVIADRERYVPLMREHVELQPIVTTFHELKRAEKELIESKDMVINSDDQEMRAMALQEVSALESRVDTLRSELMILLLPKDPNDDKNVILEIRAGAGGDESGIFAGELFQAYVRYAESYRWKVEIISESFANVGGYKEVIAKIDGQGAFSRLKYERGVHRVQRVPQTETQGRVHTSTVTVAVLPEAEEVEIDISDKDLRIDVYRSSGPGGQSVNTTDSAVRVTHLPTGMIVTCQDEKSQHKNKAKALSVLKARLLAMKQDAADAERRDEIKSQIGSGDRSEKVRTYNFPQARVTDHRIGLTIYQLDSVMKGDLNLVIEPLISHYRAEALRSGT
jgi:peptide chain release factor 1